MKIRFFILVLMVLLCVGFFGSCIPPYEISGSVKDASDCGIEGVTINFSGGYSSVITDSKGYWSKSGLRGFVEITPKKNNYSFDPEKRDAIEPNNAVNFTAIYNGEYTVSGKITDGINANGISGVKLTFSGPFGYVYSNASGEWSKSGLTGNVTITPSKEGWIFEPSSKTVSGEKDEVNFEGFFGYDVSGVVTNETGQPLSNVTINFSGDFTPTPTDSTGKWSKTGLSGRVTVTPSKENYNFYPESLEVFGETNNVNFQGFNSPTLSGRVIDEKGNGINDVLIRFSGENSSVPTDENGYWVKTDISGDITVTPEKSGYAFSPTSLIKTAPEGNINFTATYTISGKVTDNSNNGIAGVTINFDGGYESVETSSTGSWTQTGLSGSVIVTPYKNGFVFYPSSTPVDGPSTSVNFSTGDNRLAGKVVDLQNNGIPGVTMSISGHGSEITDQNGDWEKLNVVGEVTVTPSKSGYTFSPSNKPGVPPATNIDFTGTYAVSGYIKDLENNPIAGVTISFDGGYGSTQTNASGYWSKSGLSGRVVITPTKSGYSFAEPSFPVEEPSTNVDFTGTYSVSGYIRDSDNNSIQGVTVSFSGSFGTTQTNTSGYWSKNGLYGRVVVTPTKSGYSFSEPSLPVDGPSSSVNFTGHQTTFSAYGQVTHYLTGEGVEDVEVHFSGYDTYATTDSNGEWSMSGLSGTVIVTPIKENWDFDPVSDTVTYTNNAAYFEGEPEPGTLKWSNTRDFGGPIKSSLAIGVDGSIIVACEDGYVYAINPNTGQKRYSWNPEGTGGFFASPAVADDGTIYIGDEYGLFHRLVRANTTSRYYISSPAIANDGVVYCVLNIIEDSERYGILFAYNPYSDSIIWESKLYYSCSGSPTLGYYGEIYIGDEAGNFYVINSSTGGGSYINIGSAICTSPAIGSDGKVYFCANDGVYATDINLDSYRKWSVSGAHSPIISEDGRIYVTTDSGYISVINPYTASTTVDATYHVSSASLNHPAIGNDGKIYVGSSDGDFNCINPDTGRTEWYCREYIGEAFASPVFGEDGVVYVASEFGLYAFYCEATGLASSWPRLRHNSRNTGRAGAPINY